MKHVHKIYILKKKKKKRVTRGFIPEKSEFRILIYTLQLRPCAMLVWPQVHLLTSMSSRSIRTIHTPLASEHSDQTEQNSNRKH